jgi:flagellar hook-associated protein 3 FlgL
MITNLDPTSELFLANVDRIQERIASASREVSSGRKVAEPSDAPDQIDTLLQLRADQQRNRQIQSNLGLALTHVQAADGALTSAIKLTDRARVLATQGANNTATTEGRQAMAAEVQSLLDQMIACSRTTVQGTYIFSGDAGDTPPYQADTASPAGVAQLTTAGATGRVEDPAGGSFAAVRTAQDIFDSRNPDGTPAADNVFAALNGLRAALLGGDQTAIAQASGAVEAAGSRLNSEQAFYGAAQGRITDAQSFAERYGTQLETQLSGVQDADIVASALALSQGNTQLQAAFQMRAAMPHKSLFDFIG